LPGGRFGSQPNGTYNVHRVSGDSNYFNSVYKVNVENDLAVNGTPTSTKRSVEGNIIVTVTDGKLTLKNAGGADNNKIDHIEITSATTLPQVSVTARMRTPRRQVQNRAFHLHTHRQRDVFSPPGGWRCQLHRQCLQVQSCKYPGSQRYAQQFETLDRSEVHDHDHGWTPDSHERQWREQQQVELRGHPTHQLRWARVSRVSRHAQVPRSVCAIHE